MHALASGQHTQPQNNINNDETMNIASIAPVGYFSQHAGWK
jgi:hypothetical protein